MCTKVVMMTNAELDMMEKQAMGAFKLDVDGIADQYVLALVAEVRRLTYCACGERFGKRYCRGNCDNDE